MPQSPIHPLGFPEPGIRPLKPTEPTVKLVDCALLPQTIEP
jgi:hypothetical protein